MTGVERVDDMEEMTRLLEQASALLQQAVETGARLRGQGPEARRSVDQKWEAFLGSFVTHLKQKGRERGENLLAGISFSRVLAWSK